MQHLEGVTDACVNFGAGKLTVYGDTSIHALEKAGAFENLSVRPENQKNPPLKISIWKKYFTLILAFILLCLGFTFHGIHGEYSIYTILAYTFTILVGGHSLLRTGFSNLLQLIFDMKTLMTVAVAGAVLIGEWREAAIVVILFAISEVLERFSLDKARHSIRSLMDIAPDQAIIRQNGEIQTIPVEDVEIGDIQIVKPGTKIAMDGRIIKGFSSINQASITGESVPVEKHPGNNAYAGTLNEEGYLEIEVTKRVEDTTLSKIIHLVEEAQAEKAPSQAFIDRFAAYYTPAIMIIALIVAVLPPLLSTAEWSTWIYQGLAVLVVGCPCALVISTPVSVVTAIGNAARNGVLIKGGIYLEEMGALKAIAFDKTGTLTRGVPAVTDIQFFSEKGGVFRLLAALEYHSNHPLASAILKKAEQEGISYTDMKVSGFQSVTGKGIQGTINGKTYYVGKPSFFTNGLTHDIQKQIKDFQQEGKTVILMGDEYKIIALAAIADELRDSSSIVMKQLQNSGVREIVMLTGDNKQTAETIGKAVGVTNVQSELLPEDKLTFIKQMRKEHKKTAMVGDGVNDAPALASATVGIAMGGAGTDTSLETADIALMADDLEKLPYTVRLSRQALRIIKQNISFAIGIKILALLLVIPGWLTLWIAIFADMGATILVTMNALRLMRTKK